MWIVMNLDFRKREIPDAKLRKISGTLIQLNLDNWKSEIPPVRGRKGISTMKSLHS
jgi:hypothetical protein